VPRRARHPSVRRSALLLVPFAVAACRADPDDPKALRNMGEDCLSCHRKGAKASDWRFTVGGTIYRTHDDGASAGLAGVRVVLIDARGRVVRLVSNRAGNFFTYEELAFPVAVELRREASERAAGVRPGPCGSGSCNECHALSPRGGARGRLYAPF